MQLQGNKVQRRCGTCKIEKPDSNGESSIYSDMERWLWSTRSTVNINSAHQEIKDRMCEGRHGLINFTLPHRKWLYWEKILRFSRKFVKFVCTTDSLGYTIPSIFFRNSGLLIYQCQQLLPSCTWPCLLLLLGDYSKLGVAEKRRMWIDGTTKSWSSWWWSIERYI